MNTWYINLSFDYTSLFIVFPPFLRYIHKGVVGKSDLRYFRSGVGGICGWNGKDGPFFHTSPSMGCICGFWGLNIVRNEATTDDVGANMSVCVLEWLPDLLPIPVSHRCQFPMHFIETEPNTFSAKPRVSDALCVLLCLQGNVRISMQEPLRFSHLYFFIVQMLNG